jgi:hypothetical protein
MYFQPVTHLPLIFWLNRHSIISWGRPGFDADRETQGACRAYSLILVKLNCLVIDANDNIYGARDLKVA